MDETQQLLEEYFKNLHPVVQQAITSAAVEEHLRKLANTHHLHLDKWEALENEVMLTLIGLKRFDEFEQNIRADLRLPTSVSQPLAADISKTVFVPIREQMERSLEHPDAAAVEGTPIEDLTQEILRGAKPPVDALTPAESAPDLVSTPPSITPATPATPTPAPAAQAAPPVPPTPLPPPAPKPTVTRTEAPVNYTPGQSSSERKDIHTDPYRIPPDA